ncbi:glycerate kinase [Natronospirillum operosum]|uniref:Glycerate kinase n=1 Tax=Natronospirillum operosum TaxID=2759953 RepID=A0A4Z0WCE5_9GAMM|nr:glycerate kinase [Natronospirillum operosum]TGG93583.1 glycerate kinase [Natronospirillum operosum]
MKIVISPDSFKESLSAMEVAMAIRSGFQKAWPNAEYCLLPVADGGEGTVQTLVDALGGYQLSVPVTGPCGSPVEAAFGLVEEGRTAVIEMAAASGLEMTPIAHRDAGTTTSFGTGELIRAALDQGVSRIILGLGGSATNDGGAGMLQALGCDLSDSAGAPIGPGARGLGDLSNMGLSALDPRLQGVRFDVACDVTNPLVGPQGATAVFGPQKGVTAADIPRFDGHLRHFGMLLEQVTGHAVLDAPGAGAAGGMGAALLAVVGASLQPGIDIVTQALRLPELIRQADLVITGEGRMDSQSIQGKAPIGVARLAQQAGVPVIGIAGALADDTTVLTSNGFDAVFACTQRPMPLAEALTDASQRLESVAGNIAFTLRVRMPQSKA